MAPMDIIIMNTHPTASFELHQGHAENLISQIEKEHDIKLHEHPSVRVHLNNHIKRVDSIPFYHEGLTQSPVARKKF
jgi:hypothetical protein